MVKLRYFAATAALVGVWLYRSLPTVKNSILYKAPLPVGYAFNGDYDAGSCEPLGPGPFDALSYCEDIAFWELHKDLADAHPKRLVLASCDPNRKNWNTVMGPLRDPNPHGSLWVYDPSIPNASLITLSGYPSGHDFHPLGLDIWPSYSNNASNLYIVNHARTRTVIEHFSISPSTPTLASHIRTITSPFFLSPNAIALTSPNSFYVSNDHVITRRWPSIIGSVLPLLETIFGIPLAFVSHVTLRPATTKDTSTPTQESPESHTFAAKWLPFPNGISLSSSKRTVAVASSSLSKIYFYSRDPLTNALTPIPERTVDTPFCPDNVRFAQREREDDDDELIVAGHPHFPSLTLLGNNATGAAAGSWVISVIPLTSEARSTKDKPSAAKESYFQDAFDSAAFISASTLVSTKPTYTLKTLFQSNGQEGGFGSSSTGIWDPDAKVLYVSGLLAPQGVIACKSSK